MIYTSTSLLTSPSTIQPLNAHYVLGELRWSLMKGLKCGSKRTVVIVYEYDIHMVQILCKHFKLDERKENLIGFNSFFMRILQVLVACSMYVRTQ